MGYSLTGIPVPVADYRLLWELGVGPRGARRGGSQTQMLQILLIATLILIVVMAIAFALTLRVAVNWGKDAVELQQHGVET